MEGQLHYTLSDTHPNVGIQFYRITFETSDGHRVQSDLLPVNFLKQADFVFYPNPVVDYLSVVSGDFDPYELSLYNTTGKKVFSAAGNGSNQFNLSALPTGLYLGLITRNGTRLKRIKVLKK